MVASLAQVRLPCRPIRKELVISKNVGPRALFFLDQVKNATIKIDMGQENYLKGTLIQLLKEVRHQTFTLSMNDRITPSHIRQARYLGQAGIEIRVGDRFLSDRNMLNLIHRFGPVQITLKTSPQIAGSREFWLIAKNLKRVNILVKPGKDDLRDLGLARKMSRRPALFPLIIELPGKPNRESLVWLAQSKADIVRFRVNSARDIKWDFIDWFNKNCLLRRIIIIPPIKISRDLALRIQGLEPVRIIVNGAECLSSDAVASLNALCY
ncbi:MAG: hypothetical protein GXP49_10860 [Deltaproteobacteria bacterium]|nr:hypothetical protein [Deltaproteobacteria bacterium]